MCSPSRRRFSPLFACLASTAAALAVALAACSSASSGDDEADAHVGSDASVDRARLAQPLRPPASCEVVIETPELLTGVHVTEGSPLTFSSNPPASGPHYPIWPAFKEYDKPVDRGYLVHAMEHGAVVLFYKCDGATCGPIVEGLRKVRDAVATDPSCDTATRVRVVIVPDPLLDVPVAAATWGWTYKAACLDLPTLTAFAKEHVNQGTEDTCASGKTF
jgi:Protein of unknown function (DUF3105)